MVCGGGVRYSGAHEAFRTFVETLQLPFAETQAGKGALVSDHPLNLGGIGVTGGMAANQLAPQADLVIGIGTRLTDFTTGSKALFSHPEVEFLLLNVAEFDALKLDATALIADACTGLKALTETLKDYRSDWGRRSLRRKRPGAMSANVYGSATGVPMTNPKWLGILTLSWRNMATR